MRYYITLLAVRYIQVDNLKHATRPPKVGSIVLPSWGGCRLRPCTQSVWSRAQSGPGPGWWTSCSSRSWGDPWHTRGSPDDPRPRESRVYGWAARTDPPAHTQTHTHTHTQWPWILETAVYYFHHNTHLHKFLCKPHLALLSWAWNALMQLSV